MGTYCRKHLSGILLSSIEALRERGKKPPRSVTMEASDAVVPFKKEKNLETVNAFLIRSYQKPYNPNAVSTQIKAYEKLSDEVAGLLNEGCEEQTTVQGQPHPDTQVFRMRPGRLVMYNSTRSSLENDLSVTDLEPRGRFYTTVLAKD